MVVKQMQTPPSKNGVVRISISIDQAIVDAIEDMREMESVIENNVKLIPTIGFIVNKQLAEALGVE